MNIKLREKAKTVKQLLRLSDEDFAKLTVIDAPAIGMLNKHKQHFTATPNIDGETAPTCAHS